MPIIKSAKKKMRQDKKREAHNDKIRANIKSLIKNMKKAPSVKNYQDVTSALDKGVKTNILHLNKSSRLKSRLSKLLPQTKSSKKPTTQSASAA